MPLIHHAQREVTVKIVYYGPGLGGKTTNLRCIHRRSRPDLRGKLVTIANDADRTLFLDLVPIELGMFRDYRVRAHLYSVPGQIAHDDTRKLILRNVDGIVLVADSQPGLVEANCYSIRNLQDNLRMAGVDPVQLPLVVQYNKRDLPNSLGMEALRGALGIPEGIVEIEASARQGWGVFETFKAIVKSCLLELDDPHTMPEGRNPIRLRVPRPRVAPPGPESMVHELLPSFEDVATSSQGRR